MNALFKKLISTTPFSKENDDADSMPSYPNHFSTHVSVLLFSYMNTKPTKFFGKTYHKCELQRDGDCTDPKIKCSKDISHSPCQVTSLPDMSLTL